MGDPSTGVRYRLRPSRGKGMGGESFEQQWNLFNFTRKDHGLRAARTSQGIGEEGHAKWKAEKKREIVPKSGGAWKFPRGIQKTRSRAKSATKPMLLQRVA